MSSIINTGIPALTLKKEVRARLSCPNCEGVLDLDATAVNWGHVIKCDLCEKKTYYPFERPWYRRRKLIFGYIGSIIVSFIVGLAVNFVYEHLTKANVAAAADPERK